MTAGVDVHGGEVSSPKDLPNGNANADGCVNGNGNDVVSVDPCVVADLNSNSAELNCKLVVEESKQLPTIKRDENELNDEEDKIETENEESLVLVNENRENNVGDNIEPENEESLVVVTCGDVDQENEVENLADKEGCFGDQRMDVDQNLESDPKLGMKAVNDQPRDVVSDTFAVNDSVDRDQGAAPQNDSFESAGSMSEELPVETARANDVANMASEIPVVDPVEELTADAEQNPVAASCPVSDVPLDLQVVSRTGTEESEQILVTGNTQDEDSETVVNDLVATSQETTELNKSLEIAERLPFPVDSENVPVESVHVDASQETTELKKSLEIAESLPVESVRAVPAVPASISDTTTEPNAGFAASTVAENSPSCEFDDVKRETENGKLEMRNIENFDSHSVDNANAIEVESGPIGDDSVSASTYNYERSEIETVVENFPSCEVHDVKREMENGKLELQSSKSSDTHPVDNADLIEVENGPIGDDSILGCPNDDARSENETAYDSIEIEKKVSDDSHTKSEVSEGVSECVDDQPIPVDNAVVESGKSGADVKAESGIEKESGVSCRDMPGEDVVVPECEAPSGSVTGVPDIVCVKNGQIQSAGGESDDQRCKKLEENEKIQFTDGESDDKACQKVKENWVIQFTGEESSDKTCQEVEGIDGIHRDETATSTPEDSIVDASETQNVGPEVVKRPFYFLVKVPRYDDENIREQIKSAQSQVDEKTRSRDAIRDEIQTIRDSCKKYGESLEAALLKERAARESLKSKRQEIDSLQSTINKVKNAISVEDIDGRIHNMEHMIAHETLPLKEEKQFIRDIKQLKQLREQFSSSMGEQDEVLKAFDQKDQIEGRMKLLRKEADSLRDNVLKAEAATQDAKRQQRDESEKLKKLFGQFKAADDIRQEAYKHLQFLKKQAYDKNIHFWKYKDDAKQANDLAFKGDKEALQHLCFNQVERVLELWNSNDEFRNEYVNGNIRSTLRRLKTLDGRALGPDEEPPVICSFVNDRVAKDNSLSQISTVKSEKTVQAVPVKPEKVDGKPIPEVGEQKNQMTKSKRPAKLSHSVNGLAIVSGRDEIEEAIEEEPKRTKEEEELARKAEELARKAEELRKEEEAANLKEQRRLEEKAKAKEALERKKRIAEKAQARATLRAQKEAEQKEKEKEKRARKKEKRNAAATEDTDFASEGESVPSSETPLESLQSSEVGEKSTTATKRPQKPSQFTKQVAKSKSVPLPLRNRGKRRMQPWMWVLIAALVVFVLFQLGNSSFSNKIGLKGFGI